MIDGEHEKKMNKDIQGKPSAMEVAQRKGKIAQRMVRRKGEGNAYMTHLTGKKK